MPRLQLLAILFIFFSSRRRHTRYWRYWSSDVCSSDLPELSTPQGAGAAAGRFGAELWDLVGREAGGDRKSGGEGKSGDLGGGRVFNKKIQPHTYLRAEEFARRSCLRCDI